MLDAILLCIRLGIQLKDLKQYVDENGQLDEKRILEQGKDLLEKRLSSNERGLEITQFNLDNLNENQKYSHETAVYTREIAERYLFEAPFGGKWDDLTQKADMVPVFPIGILMRCDVRPIQFSFYVQVLHLPKSHERIITIPAGPFLCFQADLAHDTDTLKVLNEKVDMQQAKTVIVSNMLLDKLHYSSRHSEIQVKKPLLC